MTGGRVVVLGKTGRNFAAGMSGGVAYVYDPDHTFDYFCNMDMVELSLVEDSVSRKELLELIRQHYLHTAWSSSVSTICTRALPSQVVCSTTGTVTSRTSSRWYLSSTNACSRKRRWHACTRRSQISSATINHLMFNL